MNFQSKNFAYVTKSFGAFLDEVHAGGRQYLRSISADQPSKLPASLASDFPTLQDDFRLPGYMAHVTDNVHSSPLRISGPVTMWLHYDVSWVCYLPCFGVLVQYYDLSLAFSPYS